MVLRFRDDAIQVQLVLDFALQLEGSATWANLGRLEVHPDHVDASKQRRASVRGASVRITIGSTLYHVVDASISYTSVGGVEVERIQGVTTALPIPAPSTKGIRELLLSNIKVTVVYPITRSIPANTQVRFATSSLQARYTLHETDPDSGTLPDVLLRDTIAPTISVNLAQTLVQGGVWDAPGALLTLPTLPNANYGNVSATLWEPLVTDVGGVLGSSYQPDITTFQFPIGSTTVTVTARDTSLNEATRDFTIVVVDTEAPRMWCRAPGQNRGPCADSPPPVIERLPADAALMAVEARKLIPVYICDNSCADVCNPDRVETHRCGVVETADVTVQATYRFNNSEVLPFEVRAVGLRLPSRLNRVQPRGQVI